MRARITVLRSLLFVALLLPSYATLAYVVLPAVWRRHVGLPADPGPLPRLSYTAEGIPADPINVALTGTRAELLEGMRAAGWFPADRITLVSGIRDAGSVLFARPYPSAPMSTHFVARRRPQDLAFEQLVGKSPRRRHHVRFWRHGGPDARGRFLWLGAASFDSSVGISRFTGEVVHHIDPRIDLERDRLFADLATAGWVDGPSWIADFSHARAGRNGGGDRWVTDGRLVAARLLGDEPEALRRSLADPEVPSRAPEGQKVPVTGFEDVARLAGRVNEEARRGIGEVDDLAVARSVGHAERAVQPVGTDVHGRGVSAVRRLQAEERPQSPDRLEDPVRKPRAVQAAPAPPVGVRSQAVSEHLHRFP